MPNLDPWMNQQSEEESPKLSKFENHLLSTKDEHQDRIGAKHHPTYNERHEKIIEMIDLTLEKYKAAEADTKKNQQNEEQVIIDNIIEELDKKKDIARNKMKKAILKDDVSMYRLEENTIDYVLFRIREMTGNKLY